jgi:hypothetical protein
MSELKMNVTVPEGVIEAHLRAAVLNALSDGDKGIMVQKMLDAVIGTNVKRDYRDKPLIVDIYEQEVKSRVTDIIKEMIAKDGEKLAASVAKQLQSAKCRDALTKACLDGLSGAHWRIEVGFTPARRD